MKILVTGSAGFIGSALSIKLLDRGDSVIGIDNHNNYYDPALKESRLSRHINHKNYNHINMDIVLMVDMSRKSRFFKCRIIIIIMIIDANYTIAPIQ